LRKATIHCFFIGVGDSDSDEHIHDLLPFPLTEINEDIGRSATFPIVC